MGPTILWLGAAALAAGPFEFRHHFVDDDLPGTDWGQTALVDVDGDRDLDFITGQNGGDIRWYEFSRQGWKRRELGRQSPSDVGGAALDVDRDGKVDFVAGGAWYRQPSDPRAGPWERIAFDPKLRGVHDLVAADLDGDGRDDVATLSDRNDLRWYGIPREDPRAPWPMTAIGPAVHAGLAAGDLDGDGDLDLVRSQVWFENADKGKEWTERKFCGIPWADRKEIAFYHLASRCRIADIDQDGRPDIVLSEAEFSGARVAWFKAPPKPRDVPWTPHVLPPSDEENRGPYHSLQVADFDLDGDPDIFSGEMERFGVPPHRWFLWENRKGSFAERVILDRNLGTHEAVAGDVDGDGDADLVGKLWAPTPGNGNRGRNHADYLENLLR